MKVLVVKLSSLGDIIHTLPALGDAVTALPPLSFDWVVEEAFAEIPAWHSAVDRVITVALRRWRRHPVRDFTGPEWRRAREALRESRYDVVIDAQGLLKSAFITRLVPAPRFGMDWSSAREGLAALAYDHRVHVPRDLHAVERTRTLFALALGYPRPEGQLDYGLGGAIPPVADLPPGLFFFHGSARTEKLWPEEQWVALAAMAAKEGYRVWLPWGNEEEWQRAQRIAGQGCGAEVLPRLNLREIAAMLQGACGAVAVDTGLGHLSAALAVPTVSLYGPTSTRLVGTRGRNQAHLESSLAGGGATDPAAIMRAISPAQTWQALQVAMAGAG